jgi:predicted N-acetyltransferase YhbS
MGKMTIMTSTKNLTTNLIFRPLTVTDVDAIIEIDERIVRRKRSSLFHEQLHEQLAKHGDESFGVLTPEGKLVGYVIAETKVYIYGADDLSAWIILLGIDPDYQDQGIGTALIKQVITFFTRKGINVIRTVTAWDWGDLVEFFSSVGFKLSDYLTLELNIGKTP